MKYFLVLALVALVFFFWQAKRRADIGQRKPPSSNTRPTPPTRQSKLQTTDMVACDVCQLHLPRNEALHVRQASYCCEAHRLQAERGL